MKHFTCSMTPEFIPSSVEATHSLRFGTEAPGSLSFSRPVTIFRPLQSRPAADNPSTSRRQHPAGWFNLTFSLFMTTDFFFSYPKATTLRTWPKMKFLPTSDVVADDDQVGEKDLQWNDDHFPIPIKAEQLFCLSVLLLPPIRAISG